MKDIRTTVTLRELRALSDVAYDAKTLLEGQLWQEQQLDEEYFANYKAEVIPALERRLARAVAACKSLTQLIVDTELENGVGPFETLLYDNRW